MRVRPGGGLDRTPLAVVDICAARGLQKEDGFVIVKWRERRSVDPGKFVFA